MATAISPSGGATTATSVTQRLARLVCSRTVATATASDSASWVIRKRVVGESSSDEDSDRRYGHRGLSAAYLLSRAHDVVVFDANDYVGGHTNTVCVDGVAIDTGFIVHNRRNYPLLTRLFDELGVETQPTVMSFSMECACGSSWSSRRPWTAGSSLREIIRFLRTADDAEREGKTLAELVRDEGYSDGFLWHYLVPMTSALLVDGAGRRAARAGGLRDRVLPEPRDARAAS